MERNISALLVAAIALWIVGGVLILLHVVGVFTTGFGHVGLYLAGMGGVLNIRHFFCQMHSREADAFNLGRECQDKIRPVR